MIPADVLCGLKEDVTQQVEKTWEAGISHQAQNPQPMTASCTYTEKPELTFSISVKNSSHKYNLQLFIRHP